MDMIGLLIFAGLTAGRTSPLDLSSELKALHFETPRYSFVMSRTQFGRIQVADWQASTSKTRAEVTSLFGSWMGEGQGSSRFTRRVGSVEQVAWIGEQNENGKITTLISLLEYPPTDGSVPEDWPTEYKQGLFRVMPDAIPSLHGVQPTRAESTLNPAGWGAMATFFVKASAAQLESKIEKALPTFQKVSAEGQIMYSRGGNNPTFRRERFLTSIGLEPVEGGLKVTERWTPGYYDFTRPDPANRFGSIAIQTSPHVHLPSAFGSEYGYATVSPSGAHGRRGLSWNFTVKAPFGALKAALEKSKAKILDPKQPGRIEAPPEGFAFEVEGSDIRVNGNVYAGRMAASKVAPKGWQPTLDFKGFSEQVRVDLSSYSTVNLNETPLNGKGSWPSKATYAWPPAPGLDSPPLPEMRQAPESVFISDGPERTINAMWRVKVSTARMEELKKFVFRPQPGSALLSVSVSPSPTMAIITIPA